MATGKELVAEVRRLAAEQPDFIYGDQVPGESSCSYFGCAIGDTSGQACIVGQALANLNVDMSMLKEVEDKNDGLSIANALRRGLLGTNYIGSELMWLGTVQAHQDNGRPWGEAVALASEGGYEV